MKNTTKVNPNIIVVNENIVKVKDLEGRIYEVVNIKTNDKVGICAYEFNQGSYIKVKSYGINWSACGTQNIKDTEGYMALMQLAIEEAKTQKYNIYINK